MLKFNFNFGFLNNEIILTNFPRANYVSFSLLINGNI